ncbi:hypothetical protein CPB83DRAFT_485385 [Crepidotus variabilis]|uniref:Uncharacterized protein n=1 Tax=Crepidotus variabilis TaxID=179855 RepID=A0A9P6EPJ3_9AGAR|nr:hypothetical protein CPB83DRAFT_485385 [Crepidotus variabilis]
MVPSFIRSGLGVWSSFFTFLPSITDFGFSYPPAVATLRRARIQTITPALLPVTLFFIYLFHSFHITSSFRLEMTCLLILYLLYNSNNRPTFGSNIECSLSESPNLGGCESYHRYCSIMRTTLYCTDTPHR